MSLARVNRAGLLKLLSSSLELDSVEKELLLNQYLTAVCVVPTESLHKKIDVASAATHEIVAGVLNKRIRITGLVLIVSDAVGVTLYAGLS